VSRFSALRGGIAGRGEDDGEAATVSRRRQAPLGPPLGPDWARNLGGVFLTSISIYVFQSQPTTVLVLSHIDSSIWGSSYIMAVIAQLAARRSHNPKVVSSILTHRKFAKGTLRESGGQA
jgi:hypothetical protein